MTIRLSDDFLSPYRKAGDPFTSLLARSTYLTKYSRGTESWSDTIQRVVEGNIALDPNGTLDEAQRLYNSFWTMESLPPGRGLWTGGVPGIPADAAYNCWGVVLRSQEDWCWMANCLMLGGGVGMTLTETSSLGVVERSDAQLAITCAADHQNAEEVKSDRAIYLPGHSVADTRQGWVEALRQVLAAAFSANDLRVDVSKVRPRGQPIKTFGGIACGPGPLANLLRAVWSIVRGAAGRKLSSVECLDITNHIGLCIKSGNVRRSALIVVGQPTDQAFRNAKKDMAAVLSHRHTSNNSLAFYDDKTIAKFDWSSLVDDVAEMGEPGIVNFGLARIKDPFAETINPCGEQIMHNREACNLAEVFPSKNWRPSARMESFQLVTRYCLRQRMRPLEDTQSDAVRAANMRIGVGIGGLVDFEWTKSELRGFYFTVRAEANRYARELGVASPLTVTTVKPSGTISLLNESSPGLHAPYAPFYIRRTRIASNDPMAPAMIEAGVPYEPCVYDKTGNTWVFSFPVAKPDASAYVMTETLRTQFARQLAVQDAWADNAVSSTLSFDESEKEDLALCLAEYVPRLKSTSVLPKAHGYAMPPYEEITRSEFEKRYAQIDHKSNLVRGGEIEIDECSTGVCPIR